jgi:hypothetical protein
MKTGRAEPATILDMDRETSLRAADVLCAATRTPAA